MPLDDALATFSYLISEADKLGVAFIELMRYVEKYDIAYDGKSQLLCTLIIMHTHRHFKRRSALNEARCSQLL